MKEYYTQKYRPLLQGVVDKCEDEFEKKLIYIAAGALGLSFAFVSDIVNINDSCCIWMLLVGWILLIACICLNCFSHLWSKRYAQTAIEKIDKEAEKDVFDEKSIRSYIDKQNKKTNCINASTIWLMTLGIALIVTYAAINILQTNMGKTSTTEQVKTNNDMKEFENTDHNEHKEYVGLGHSMPSPIQVASETTHPVDSSGETGTPIEQANNGE